MPSWSSLAILRDYHRTDRWRIRAALEAREYARSSSGPAILTLQPDTGSVEIVIACSGRLTYDALTQLVAANPKEEMRWDITCKLTI